MKYYHGSKLIYKFLRDVFPEVDEQLERWAEEAGPAPDGELAAQALASIRLKRFHSQGGSAYALYPGVDMRESIRFIVALQTISDYLDNLCDRVGVQDEAAFRQLHLAMLDAVDPDPGTEDYYRFYPFYMDNGYLHSLVDECKACIRKLPAYLHAEPYMKKYVQLYSDLQALKHLPEGTREKRIAAWAENHLAQNPGINIWEFSAATGSTLGVFTMFAAAQNPSFTADQAAALDNAYFPWICGLHILLDYYIDIQEDLETNDLNLTWHDSDPERCRERLSLFVRQARLHCKALPFPKFHITIVRGLLAMYLSDPKALSEPNRVLSSKLVKSGGPKAYLYYCICRHLRETGKL